MRFLLRYLEIVFTLAGLAVVALVSTLFTPAYMSRWVVAAITALAVGVIHGFLFWFVRRRQRELRHGVIMELQDMLQDVVNNQLAIILRMTELRHDRPADAERAGVQVTLAVQTIANALRQLDEDGLRQWQVRFPDPTGRPRHRD